MKRFKLLLAALTLISSVSYAEFTDIPSDHWANEAVKNLANKGLLPQSMDSAVVFKGDGVFSRYEVASMLYMSLNNIDDKLTKKASKEDIDAFKLLVKDFSPELTKIGAKTDELAKKIESLEKNAAGDLEKKLSKKIEALDDKIAKVKVSGDFTAKQEIGMKDSSPGMKDLDYAGTISIVGNVGKNVSVLTKLGMDKDIFNADKYPKVKALELKAKSEVFALSLFKDGDKDPDGLLAFGNTLGIFEGKAVSPKQGVLFNGTNKNPYTNTNYVGLLFKTDSGDFYGLQVKNEIVPLKNMGIDSFIRMSYSEKVVKYQYDNKYDPDNAKAFYTIDTALSMKPLKSLDLTVAGEYGTRRSPGIEDKTSDELSSIANSRDALYFYTNANYKWTDKFKTYGILGFYNAGEYFDIAGVGNNTKTVFSEIDTVKLEADRMAFLYKLGATYDFVETAFTYASFGSTIKSTIPKTKLFYELTAEVLKNIYKPSFSYMVEKDERTIKDVMTDKADSDQAKYLKAAQELKDKKIQEHKGKWTLEQKNKINIGSNIETNLNFTYIKNEDNAIEADTDNKLIMYGDYGMNITSDIYFKAIGKYTEEGAGLKDTLDKDLESGVQRKNLYGENQYKFNSKDNLKKLESAFGLEVKGLKAGKTDLGKLNFGARYASEDKKGMTLEQAKSLDAFGKNTEKSDDKEKYGIFGAHEFNVGKLKVTYGLAYKIEKKYIQPTGTQTIGEVKDDDSSNDVVYAVGLEYDFGNSIVGKGSYGDPKVVTNDQDFMLDKTSFADGDQKIAKVEISAKF